MPTKRAWIFLILALALYFLANQTQVGWIYVITAGLVAILLVAFCYAWGMLKLIRLRRTFRNLSASPGPNGSRIGIGVDGYARHAQARIVVLIPCLMK